jgi:riboflavin synthase
MFTGIVEERGRVRAITPSAGGAQLVIDAQTVLSDVELGASIAVNGCCLTVTAFDADSFAADAVIETLARTNLGDLAAGDPVNLERPLRLADRLGGHLVQGHVDTTGTVRDRAPQPDGSEVVTIEAPENLLRYVVHKGSITVDGVSLTVARVDDDAFATALIPHTLVVTTLGARPVGARVNLEVDLVAKYVEALVERAARTARTGEHTS